MRSSWQDRLAGAPISWGVCEVPGWGYQLQADRVLTEMAAAGLRATEFGPDGFLPDDPAARAAVLARHGLAAVGGFVPLVLHRADHDPVAELERLLPAFLASGAGMVVLAAVSGGDGYDARPQLDAAAWATLCANLDRAAAAVAERGLRAALHPHVGTVVEQRGEVRRVLDGSMIGLCLDTGHLLVGGTDPLEIARASDGRVAHVHLKDVDAELAARVRAGEIGYAAAVRAGLYRPLGSGDADVAGVVSALEAAGYAGWYVMEQDRVLAEPPPGAAAADATAGIRADVAAGIAHLRSALAAAVGMSEPLEVLTMGRVGVDVYPRQIGVGLEDVSTFGKYLGGSATNVAVAAARYGRSSAVITRVGADPFGRFVRRALGGFGVSDAYVREVAGLPTPVTFCEIFPPDNFPLYFYRHPSAPDLKIRADELDLDAIRGAGVFWATVTGLCQEPSRTATLTALEARGRAGVTVLDLDWRAPFWDSADAARPWVRAALEHVSVAVGNLDECEVAVGEREPAAAAKALHRLGVGLAVVKRGPDGVFASDGTRQVWVPPTHVDVVNGLGAGDSFGGALCHGLLAGWELERTLRFASAAGAIVASRLACADAMPTADEVEAYLAGVPAGG